MEGTNLTRREFLKAAGVAAGAVATAGLLYPGRAEAAPPELKTKHVVFIAFAGGVRSREWIGSPNNIPNLAKLMKDGVALPNIRTQNVGHYGATLSLFTGITEVMGIRENQRGEHPTLFEYLRKQKGTPANKVWLSCGQGNQQLNFSYGTHADFGSGYGANVISGDGIFNAEFKEVLDAFGRPKALTEGEGRLLDKLRGSMDAEQLKRATSTGLSNDAASVKKIENFILEEITAGAPKVTGPGAEDAKATRVATNILRVFQPTFLGVALSNADVAHGSFNAYVDVIRRNDDEVGKLIAAIQADPELKDSTSFFIMPEFGRDSDTNQRNGLDHGDSGPDLLKIGCIAYGPDFKRGKTIETHYDSIDLCPTILHLLGGKADLSRAKVMKEILA
ncbi:MAG: twin-arginine translocation signal domain-containing protein [Planctomycetota bacterium]